MHTHRVESTERFSAPFVRGLTAPINLNLKKTKQNPIFGPPATLNQAKADLSKVDEVSRFAMRYKLGLVDMNPFRSPAEIGGRLIRRDHRVRVTQTPSRCKSVAPRMRRAWRSACNRGAWRSACHRGAKPPRRTRTALAALAAPRMSPRRCACRLLHKSLCTCHSAICADSGVACA